MKKGLLILVGMVLLIILFALIIATFVTENLGKVLRAITTGLTAPLNKLKTELETN